MKIITPEQAQRLDKQTFSQKGYTSENFVEQAGALIAAKIQFLYPKMKRALALCGPGNNGADGRVAAKFLKKAGWQVQVFQLDPKKLDFKAPIQFLEHSSSCLLIDALFGTGLDRPLDKKWKDLFDPIESARLNKQISVLSVDTPSGLNAKTGILWGPTIKTDRTLAIQAVKIGFLQNDGPDTCGTIEVLKLNYPQKTWSELPGIKGIGPKWAHRVLPERSLKGNKGSFGRVHIVAGSQKYPGSAILAAKGALRSGAGYVNVIQFDSGNFNWSELAETLREEWPKIPKDWQRPGNWCLGPGVTDEDLLQELLQKLLHSKTDKVVVDATALSLVPKLKMKIPKSWILTPHPKELANILKVSTDEVQNDRLAAILEATHQFGGTFLLKGFKTLISNHHETYVCILGHSVLAKAGSGDVLSGVISGLREQNLDAMTAAGLGATAHAMTGDFWCKTRDVSSMIPDDMIQLLPEVLKKIRGSKG